VVSQVGYGETTPTLAQDSGASDGGTAGADGGFDRVRAEAGAR